MLVNSCKNSEQQAKSVVMVVVIEYRLHPVIDAKKGKPVYTPANFQKLHKECWRMITWGL